MLGEEGEDGYQGEGGAQAEPEDHIRQVSSQPRADLTSGSPPAGEMVGKTPGGDTATLTETESRVPEMVRPS